MKVLICSNLGKDKDFNKTKEIIDYLNNKNCDVVVAENMINSFPSYQVFNENIAKEIDVMIILGGDGTFLSAAHRYYQYQIPCIGINLGRVGYLTECDVCDSMDVLDKIVNKEYDVKKKRLLQVKFFNNGRMRKVTAFNEIVIHRGASQKMIKLNIKIDDYYMNSFYADGLLIATSLGSSAYNLSARGPLVLGNAPCFVITPICPQSGIMPSFVVADTDYSEINVLCKNREDYSLSIDGKGQYLMPSGSTIYVTKSQAALLVINVKGKSKKLDHINKMFSGYIK